MNDKAWRQYIAPETKRAKQARLRKKVRYERERGNDSTYDENEGIDMFNPVRNNVNIPASFLHDKMLFTLSAEELLNMDTLNIQTL